MMESDCRTEDGRQLTDQEDSMQSQAVREATRVVARFEARKTYRISAASLATLAHLPIQREAACALYSIRF